MNSYLSSLFTPVTLGEVELPNKIVMASMSRARTDNPGLIPNELQVEYYRQRASAGLILTEGTWPSAEAVGAALVPGLFTKEQVEGWKRITDAVHDAGGRIFVQLGHTGAGSHPKLLNGNLPLAPSPVSLNLDVFVGELVKSPVPKEMNIGDINRTIDDYAKATQLAQEAGFDGVELHGTVGYLIPQFLNENFNLRQDQYGGSIENRCRFPLEVLKAMISEWRPGRVGFKTSPAISMGDLHPTEQTIPTYEHLLKEISALNIAYVQMQNSAEDLTGTAVEQLSNGTAEYFRSKFNGPIIANGGLTKSKAEGLINSGIADAVAFGADYLANPDLVERLREGKELAPVPDRDYWYGGGKEGYIDFSAAM